MFVIWIAVTKKMASFDQWCREIKDMDQIGTGNGPVSQFMTYVTTTSGPKKVADKKVNWTHQYDVPTHLVTHATQPTFKCVVDTSDPFHPKRYWAWVYLSK